MVPVVYPNLTGNWQIQTTSLAANGVLPPSNVLLLGALQNSGANVSGTFRYSNLGQTGSCPLNEVVTMSGTVDAAGNLSLASTATSNGPKVKVALLTSASVTSFAKGSIEVDGATCAIASSPANGIEIAPIAGTYRGPLTLVAPSGAATVALDVSLVASQTSTPGADGQFPLTGTLGYTLESCSGMVDVAGEASGVGVTLTSAAATPSDVPTVSLFGVTEPTADQITVANVDFTSFSCMGAQPPSGFYSGKLVRQ